MHEMVKVFKALSDETRLRILNLVSEKECCVCEVMQALNISQTRASRNLGVLHDAGLLQLRKEGLWSLYSIDQRGSNPYLPELVRVVREALAGNEVSVLDRQRLTKAKLVGPGCGPRPAKRLQVAP